VFSHVQLKRPNKGAAHLELPPRTLPVKHHHAIHFLVLERTQSYDGFGVHELNDFQSPLARIDTGALKRYNLTNEGFRKAVNEDHD